LNDTGLRGPAASGWRQPRCTTTALEVRMRLVRIGTATVAALILVLAPVEAAPKGPKIPHSTKAPSTKAPSGKPVHTKAPKAGGPSKSAKPPKVAAGKAPKTATGKATAKTTTAATTTTTSTSTPTTTTTGSATSTTIDFTKGAVAERLAKNTNLRTKLESRLLASGYEGTVYEAAYGFRNQGQFIAATNVSQNLGIPFEALKLEMTGVSVGADGAVTTVDTPTKSLGEAIKSVRSDVDADAAALTATQQADADLTASNSTSK
jgi:hypothetical protein